MAQDFKYLSGFGNEFSTEALEGALPKTQNNPQRSPLGLYAEQISGTSFTTPRAKNKRSWLYRTLPSVKHEPFKKTCFSYFKSSPFVEVETPPHQLRWNPLPLPSQSKNFIEGIITLCGNGDLNSQTGFAIHLYAANTSMTQKAFYNADGDFLIVPQLGTLLIQTELGVLDVTPGDMVVIPRGIKFSVSLPEKKALGYICENYGAPFELPELGPIGANGLAYPRDFLIPVAFYEKEKKEYKLLTKFQGSFWEAALDHSPFDVVAWHGNYAPYKYDLKKFNVINTVSFDHPDPSIFTVLTSPSVKQGVANIDFVIFKDRWMVSENTFRPPYFHRNIMSEFMGLIFGKYDAKEDGFLPGGSSIHNSMSAHGPDAQTFKKASEDNLKPHKIEDTLAFMFESSYVCKLTPWALETDLLQKDYYKCWQDLE